MLKKHYGGDKDNHRHTDKETRIYNKGDDEFNDIENLRVMLNMETQLTSDKNFDVERIKTIMNKIDELSPPDNYDVDKSLQDFRRKLENGEFDGTMENLKAHKSTKKIKFIIPLIAVILVGLLGVGASAFKFNLFEMLSDFGGSIKRVVFEQDSKNKNAPPEEFVKSEEFIFYNYQDAFDVAGFSFPYPRYLPENTSNPNIKIEKLAGNNYSFYIEFTVETECILAIAINYSESALSSSVNYEFDYEETENINVLGQSINIVTDNFNKKCNFNYGAFIYSISTSNEQISLSEFKKVVESIN